MSLTKNKDNNWVVSEQPNNGSKKSYSPLIHKQNIDLDAIMKVLQTSNYINQRSLTGADKILSSLQTIMDQLVHIVATQNEITEQYKEVSTLSQEGDSMSSEIIEKIHSIDIRLSKTETLVGEINTKLDRLDSKLDQIVTKEFVEKKAAEMEASLTKTLATKEYVGQKASETEASLLKWIIGTAIASAALISTIVFGIIKIYG